MEGPRSFNRRKVIPEKPNQPSKEISETVFSRRSLLRGAIAAAAGAVVLNRFDLNEEKPLEKKTKPEAQTEANFETEEVEYSDSMYFDARVEGHVPLFEQDIDFILEYGGKITNGDFDKRTRLEYLSEELEVEGLSSEALLALQKAVAGLAIQESRCDASRVSDDGAVGMLMIMPSTWKEHAEEGMNPLSLRDQVIVMGRLLSQSNKHLENTCKDELEQIKNNMFGGDTVKFEKEFKVPVLMSCYHAGMGTLSQVIQGFAAEFKTPEDTVGGLSENTEQMTGYDVFYLMVNTAYTKGEIKNFGDDSLEYVFKSMAAERTLHKVLEPEERMALLGRA